MASGIDYSVIKENGIRVITGHFSNDGWHWLHIDIFSTDKGKYIAHYELEKCPCCHNGTVFVRKDTV